MYWIKEMRSAIAFIEERLTEDLALEEIARSANSSSANFQRIFTLVTGMTVGEYIRARRLSLAGKELARGGLKVIDAAVQYGFESAESFTKAFTRFHGLTPSAARRPGAALKVFAALSIHVEINGGFSMRRKLIPNVPEIPYDGNNAAFFITLLEATLKGLGEECDKAMLTALSGEGNRFCWTGGAWVFGNEITQSINQTPFETEQRVLSATGWKAKYITVQRGADGGFLNTDAAQIRQDFIAAIDSGYPVLIRYIEHPDCDLNVFFGYADDGEKIIGYDYNHGYQAGVSAPSDVSAPVSWGGWENNLAGYILLQGKSSAASEREAALAAFRFISAHARQTAEIRGKKVGLAAWESFLTHLEHDDFSSLSAEEVQSRFFIYCDALCQINARNGALPYYRRLAERFPEWREPLEAAVQALDACAAYGGFLWSQGFTFDAAGFEKFRSPEARQILAAAGREAMRQDRLAVEQFERILST
jgi:AraC-like DNA-binding protein